MIILRGFTESGELVAEMLTRKPIAHPIVYNNRCLFTWFSDIDDNEKSAQPPLNGYLEISWYGKTNN